MQGRLDRVMQSRPAAWWVAWWPGDWEMTRLDTRIMWRGRMSAAVVCPLRGHDWYPDHCGRPEHDLCYRCNVQRGPR